MQQQDRAVPSSPLQQPQDSQAPQPEQAAPRAAVQRSPAALMQEAAEAMRQVGTLLAAMVVCFYA